MREIGDSTKMWEVDQINADMMGKKLLLKRTVKRRRQARA